MTTSILCENPTHNADLGVFRQHIKSPSLSFLDKDNSGSNVHNSTMGKVKTKAAEALSRWLQDAIQAAGTNQSELARAVGLTSQKVNRTIHLEREMSAEELILYAAHFKRRIPSLPGVSLTEAQQPLLPKPQVSPDPRADAPLEPSDEVVDLDFERAFAVAVEIEKMEHGGEAPHEKFAEYVRRALVAQKSIR